MQATQAPRTSTVGRQKRPTTVSPRLLAQTRKARSPSTSHTTHSWSCMQRCRKSGNTPSPRHKRSPHIQYQATGVSMSLTAGIATLCTREIRLDASVVSMRSFDVHSGNKKPGVDTCGCVTLDMYQENKVVHSSSGPSSTMMVIPCGLISARKKRMPRLWPIFQLLNNCGILFLILIYFCCFCDRSMARRVEHFVEAPQATINSFHHSKYCRKSPLFAPMGYLLTIVPIDFTFAEISPVNSARRV